MIHRTLYFYLRAARGPAFKKRAAWELLCTRLDRPWICWPRNPARMMPARMRAWRGDRGADWRKKVRAFDATQFTVGRELLPCVRRARKERCK
ncbi:MAG: hypothetical protein WB816_15955 [Methylocystis sp.]